jgi:hypothetical protein
MIAFQALPSMLAGRLTTQRSGRPTAQARCSCVALCLWAAAHVLRVCQAWHRTREVQVLVPGIRGAEGEEQGQGAHHEVGSGGSPIHTCRATHRNRIGGVVHPGRVGT